MALNIDSIFDLIKQTLTSAYKSESGKVKIILEDLAQDTKERLAQLAAGAASGELSYKFVTTSLKEEAKNLEDNLLAVAEVSGSDLQGLINQAIGIFEIALKSSIEQV